MSRRHYINDASVVALTASINNSVTTCIVTDASTFPTSFPWTAILDAGTATAEVVLVTGASGTTLTITRAYDSTSAQAHANAATFAHVAVKADFDEANSHVNATTGVHGLTGSVVGTTDAQTLTNKTLTSPVLATPAFSGTVSSGITSAGGIAGTTGTFSGAVTSAAGVTGTVITGTSYEGPVARGYLGSAVGSGSTSLPDSGANTVSTGSVTFTLAETRRIGVVGTNNVRFGTGATTPGAIQAQVTYIAGSTPSATLGTAIGAASSVQIGALNLSQVIPLAADVQLTAGTWTAYYIVTTTSGGSTAADTTRSCYLRVDDLGPN